MANVRISLQTNNSTGHAIEAVDQRGYGNLWGVVHQQVNVAVFPVELHQLRLEVRADAGEEAAQGVQ